MIALVIHHQRGMREAMIAPHPLQEMKEVTTGLVIHRHQEAMIPEAPEVRHLPHKAGIIPLQEVTLLQVVVRVLLAGDK